MMDGSGFSAIFTVTEGRDWGLTDAGGRDGEDATTIMGGRAPGKIRPPDQTS